MSSVTREQLNELRARAGSRYKMLVFYQELLHVMAWLNLGVCSVATIVMLIMAANRASLIFAGYAILLLLAGIASFVSIKITANAIKAFVDIAVNSHLQVHLQSLDR